MARHKTKKQKKKASKKVSQVKVKAKLTKLKINSSQKESKVDLHLATPEHSSTKKIGSKIALHLSTPRLFSKKKIGSKIGSKIAINKKSKTKTTLFSDSQVKLLYRDLLKTFVVTVVVFAVLLSIFVYMR